MLVAATSSSMGANRVLVVSDSGSVSFGMMLSKAQRRWVRDCIIAVISK